jgi:hypothetical protein
MILRIVGQPFLEEHEVVAIWVAEQEFPISRGLPLGLAGGLQAVREHGLVWNSSTSSTLI